VNCAKRIASMMVQRRLNVLLVLLVVVVHDINATNVIDIHGRGHVIQSSCY